MRGFRDHYRFILHVDEEREQQVAAIRHKREQDLVDRLADPLQNTPYPPIPEFITRQSELFKQATRRLSPLSNSSFLFWSARMRPELESKRRMHVIKSEVSSHHLFYEEQFKLWYLRFYDKCRY